MGIDFVRSAVKNLSPYRPIALSSSKKKAAFTLAEVLITLGIIGILAVLIIPSFVSNYREKRTTTQLKKAYSTLSNAYVSILNEYGPPATWNVENWDDINDMFREHIINVKKCSSGMGSGCFKHIQRKDLLGNSVDTLTASSFIMPNGIVVGIDSQIQSISEALNCEEFHHCLLFIVDVNGDKGPNQWGVDTFEFVADKKVLKPLGASDTHGRNIMCVPDRNTTAAGWWNGQGCSAWVIYKGNMDYLKCVKGDEDYCGKKYYFD